MKHAISLLFVVAAVIATYAKDNKDLIWHAFENPSDECRTKVWWFHGETETTKEGIDADLKAFRDAGVGGVVFYDQVHSSAKGAFDSMSPEWWEMLKYAAVKAKEIGLSFEVAASNGYVAGGPWITPDLGMQITDFVDSVIIIPDGIASVDIDLPHADKWFRDIATIAFPVEPELSDITIYPGRCELTDNTSALLLYDCDKPVIARAITYTVSPRGKGSTGSMNIPGKPSDRYFGGKYIEMPPVGELEYSLDGKTWLKATALQGVESVIGYKSKDRTISFPAVKGRYFRVNLHDWKGDDPNLNKLWIENIRLSQTDVVDNWQTKVGLRTEVTYPSKTGGDFGAIRIKDIRDLGKNVSGNGSLKANLGEGSWRIIRFGHRPMGAKTKHGRKNMLGPEADVMSAKAATVQYNNYFKAILDTLAAVGVKPEGMCMDSHEAGVQNWTSGFENKFREMNGYDITRWLPALAGYIVEDRENTDRVLRDFRQAIAATIASEFYGTLQSLCNQDGVTFTSQAMLNICNDNILSRGQVSKPQGEFWAYQENGNYDCLDAASSAHLYGMKIASGEAFTDTPYHETWDELLRIANIAYCRGVNEFVVCASSYQPWLDRKYDDDASAHPYIFHRHNPNWDTVKPFWDYQARCTQMMRLGEPVVDFCVYLGEELPGKTMAYKLPVIPEGFSFDVATKDALLNRFHPGDNGSLNVEGGMKYRALIVEDRTYISPEVERKLSELAKGGVTVIRCDKGESVAETLDNNGIKPFVSYESVCEPDDCLLHFHRAVDGHHILFLYNHSNREYDAPISFSSRRKNVELWNPKTLNRKKVTLSNGNVFQLTLAPYESIFMVI